MKKAISLILSAAMVFSLAACGNTSSSGTAQTTKAAAVETTQAAANETTQAAAEMAAPAEAQDDVNWPTENLTLLIGLSAGGGSDLGARVLADALGKELGVTVTCENITGGGSWIMWNQLLHNTEPDGNTFGFVNHNIVFGEYDDVNPREDGIDDFNLLMGQLVDYGCLLVREDDDRFPTFEAFVEYAKENDLMTSNTTMGITDGDATCIEAMRKYLGCNFTSVQADGGSDAMTMLLAGDIDFYLNNVSSAIRLEDDGIRVLCQYAPERLPEMPDVPTAAECGFDYDYCSIRGFAYPQGVDEKIKNKMINAMRAAMNREDYKEAMANLSQTPTPMEPDEFYETLMGQLEGRLEVYGLEKH